MSTETSVAFALYEFGPVTVMSLLSSDEYFTPVVASLYVTVKSNVLLLFVGGVMNLAWIAALAILVLIEKALPAGQWVGRGAGVALIGWGVATLVV